MKLLQESISPAIFEKEGDIDMTEEDIKLRFINPEIPKGWENRYIFTEQRITDGKITVSGNFTHQEKPLRADYVLYMNEGRPLAVIEAKSDPYSVSAGLQQAKIYAEKLRVPFAYSSNGYGFQEYDYLTGIERFIPYRVSNSEQPHEEPNSPENTLPC